MPDQCNTDLHRIETRTVEIRNRRFLRSPTLPIHLLLRPRHLPHPRLSNTAIRQGGHGGGMILLAIAYIARPITVELA